MCTHVQIIEPACSYMKIHLAKKTQVHISFNISQASGEVAAVYNSSGSNTDGSITMAISNSFLSPLEKNSIAADIIIFAII